MSYILDALRKSEAERRQGKAPDLGQPVQMVYRAKRKPVSAVTWVALALFVNAGVLAYLFWPAAIGEVAVSQAPESRPAEESDAVLAGAEPRPEAPNRPEAANPVRESGDQAVAEYSEAEALSPPVRQTEPQSLGETYEAPVVIVPSRADSATQQKITLTDRVPQGRVPHLVELPLSFQKSVPDLTFNSHIVSSDPSASRVMINGHYLQAGDRFGGLAVEQITDDGVVLSKDGRLFRVGTVRDWVSPQ